MEKTEKESAILKKILILNVVTLMVFWGFILGVAGVVFYVLQPIRLEKRCDLEAKKITGTDRNVLIESNGNQITRYYQEYIKCRNRE
jgi:hypothetical protein